MSQSASVIADSPYCPTGTCAASYVRLITQLLDQFGHGGSALAERCGIDPAALQAEGWIPHAQVLALWRAAAEATGDEAFGLTVASRLGPESFAALGHSLMLGSTLGESYRRAARDLNLLGDLFDIRIEACGADSCIELAVCAGQQAADACIDAGLAAILVTGRRLCADPALTPREVNLRRPSPADPTPFAALFGRMPRFGAVRNRLVFDAADMARPVFSGHPALAELFDRELAAKRPEGLAGRLRTRLVALLPEGPPSLERLARELHVSPRTLHRRLAEEGTGHRRLLDTTRRELAQHYLARTDLPVGHIGALLGFSEPASFSRACRRWFGRSPHAWRGGEG